MHLLLLSYSLLAFLNATLSGIKLVLSYRLVIWNDFLRELVLCCLHNLLLKHGLSLIIEKPYAVLLHEFLNGLFNPLVIQRHVYVLTMLEADVLS